MIAVKPAIVLLSGGLDSTVLLALAKEQSYEVNAITFRYGQRHYAEIAAARDIARTAAVARHAVVDVHLRWMGGHSALTTDEALDRSDVVPPGISNAYVPGRNTIFLSHALGWAEILKCEDIFIGITKEDHEGFPDCRPSYIDAFQEMAQCATGKNITVHDPLTYYSKAEVIKVGTGLGVDFSETVTCYDASGSGTACGTCNACISRLAAFKAAGLTDPVKYR